MSAYVTKLGGGEIRLIPESSDSAAPAAAAQIPSLPQIGGELESFFAIARQIEAALIQERVVSRKNQSEFRGLQERFSKHCAELEAKLKEAAAREEKMKAQLANQIANQQKNEKRLQDKAENFNQSLTSLREETNKKEIDYLAMKNELGRYKSAWHQVSKIDQKAKETMTQMSEMSLKMEEMTEALDREKKKSEQLEEQLQKEKREKRAALTCLHTAESKLSQMKNSDPGLLELKF